MRKLNTEDFLESDVKLEEIKDDSILGVAMAQAMAHAHLATILTVCIEYGKSFDEIQEVLDGRTQNNQTELAKYAVKEDA
jgi:hypothetical protein